jgi:hypothetical protein
MLARNTFAARPCPNIYMYVGHSLRKHSLYKHLPLLYSLGEPLAKSGLKNTVTILISGVDLDASDLEGV